MTTDAGGYFGADPAHVEWFGGRVLRAVSIRPPRRVLDIGCGDGTLLQYLADALPGAMLVGVDLSPANIAAARAAVERSPHRHRIEIIHHDYLTLDAGRFDLVVASSSLQGAQTTTEQLADAIARDVTSAGRFIHVTPYACVYNTVLNRARIILRAVRGTATDHMILAAARVLHRGEPRARLAERVPYMYLVVRHYEDGIRRALERRGFALEGLEDAPHTSLGQPKHRLAIMDAPRVGPRL